MYNIVDAIYQMVVSNVVFEKIEQEVLKKRTFAMRVTVTLHVRIKFHDYVTTEKHIEDEYDYGCKK